MTRRLLAISWDMPPLSGPRAVQVSRLLKQLSGGDAGDAHVLCTSESGASAASNAAESVTAPKTPPCMVTIFTAAR